MTSEASLLFAVSDRTKVRTDGSCSAKSRRNRSCCWSFKVDIGRSAYCLPNTAPFAEKSFPPPISAVFSRSTRAVSIPPFLHSSIPPFLHSSIPPSLHHSTLPSLPFPRLHPNLKLPAIPRAALL